MLKKFLKKVLEFILEKNSELKYAEKEIKELSEEIKSFNILIHKDISLYKLSLLKYKHQLLNIKKSSLKTKYLNNKSKTISNTIKYRLIKQTILVILILTLLSSRTILAILLLLLASYVTTIYTTNSILFIYNLFKEKEIDENINILKESEALLNISEKEINKKIERFNKYTNNIESKNTSYYFYYAQSLISNYLQNHNINIINKQPDIVKNIIIDILKEDLSINDNNIETLLELAYKNVNNIKELSEKELKLTNKT